MVDHIILVIGSVLILPLLVLQEYPVDWWLLKLGQKSWILLFLSALFDIVILRNACLLIVVKTINSSFDLRANLRPGNKRRNFRLLSNFGPEAHWKDIKVYFKTQLLAFKRHDPLAWFLISLHFVIMHLSFFILHCNLLSFLIGDLVLHLNGRSNVQNLFTERVDEFIEILLLLVILVDHEDTTLLVWPFKITLKAYLFAIWVSREERVAQWGVKHVNQALDSQE